jgi:hypothetical protein
VNNGKVIKEGELAMKMFSFYWRQEAMLHQVSLILANFPCTILTLAQPSHNCETCIETWLFASVVFPVFFGQFHKLKNMYNA